MIMKKIIVDGKEVYVPINREEAKQEMKNGNDLIFTDEDEKDDLEDEIEDEEERLEEEREAQEENEENEGDDDEDNEDNEDDEDDDNEEDNDDGYDGDTTEEQNSKSNKDFYDKINDFSKKVKDSVKKSFSAGGTVYVNTDKIAKGASNIVKDVNRMVANATKGFSFTMNHDDSANPKSKTSQLLKVLPFMEDEDIHELIQDLLNSEESLKDVKITAILPFLSDEDCDELFMKAINDGNTNYRPESVAPFVSEKCLSKIVDQYLEGKFPNLNIDSLYPFLSSKDIKRIFKHIMGK